MFNGVKAILADPASRIICTMWYLDILPCTAYKGMFAWFDSQNA